MSFKDLFCVYIVITLVPYVFSIKCWNCRSNNDPKCADPFDNSTVPITDCKQAKGLPHLPGLKASMCRKIRQKVNGEWRYFRDCAYLGDVGIQGDERFCLMRTGGKQVYSPPDGKQLLKPINVCNTKRPPPPQWNSGDFTYHRNTTLHAAVLFG